MLKKIIYLIVSGGLLLSGCSLDYEPLNGPSSGSFPASEEEAMAGLYAAYKGLANMTVKETPFPMRINDCISDIGTYRTGAGNQIKAMRLDADGRQHDVREGIQDGLQNRRPRASGAGQSGQTAGRHPRRPVQPDQSRTALYPRLLLRLGVPVLRRHPLHRPPGSIWTITPTIRVSRASR